MSTSDSARRAPLAGALLFCAIVRVVPALAEEAGDTDLAMQLSNPVAALISDAGFKVVDIGAMSNGHLLDKAAAFIIEMGYGQGMGTGVGLQIVKAVP